MKNIKNMQLINDNRVNNIQLLDYDNNQYIDNLKPIVMSDDSSYDINTSPKYDVLISIGALRNSNANDITLSNFYDKNFTNEFVSNQVKIILPQGTQVPKNSPENTKHLLHVADHRVELKKSKTFDVITHKNIVDMDNLQNNEYLSNFKSMSDCDIQYKQNQIIAEDLYTDPFNWTELHVEILNEKLNGFTDYANLHDIDNSM